MLWVACIRTTLKQPANNWPPEQCERAAATPMSITKVAARIIFHLLPFFSFLFCISSSAFNYKLNITIISLLLMSRHTYPHTIVDALINVNINIHAIHTDDDELASPAGKKRRRPSLEEKTKGSTRMASAASDDELAKDGLR